MDISLQTHRDYLGKPLSSLPTPALVISRPILEKNLSCLLQNVSGLGISFRPHVKTLKTLEVTRMMLYGGKHRSIVASTVCEIEGALPLVKEGLLDECLYGFPIAPSVLPRLHALTKAVKISLMLDSEQQIDILENYASDHPELESWQIFIKVDVGSHRAGLEKDSDYFRALLQRAEKSDAVNIQGLYCHAGHSYGCRSKASVEDVLQLEIDSLIKVAQEVSPGRQHPLILSLGSTPTAHSIKSIKHKLPSGCILELHAGNFLANDLQQLSTGMIEKKDLSVRVVAEVCSVYAERNEALINAGVIAMSREASAFPGFGILVDKPDWHIVRLSQEHGILGLPTEEVAANGGKALENFQVGQKVQIYCQHTCITAAAFYVYYVVDENDIVCDVWIPWKGW